ncbi:MAG TPA: hypothetical protein VHD33_03320, partial [Legionellaceae bacterium]|nr:hypothetical protein [Legionellaceae bacterium]
PLSLGRTYPVNSPRELLYQQRMHVLSDLESVMTRQEMPCTIAQRWSEYALSDILWLLYAVTVKLIHRSLLGLGVLEKEYLIYTFFVQAWRAEYLFGLLDSIQVLIKKLQQNVPLNSALALERVLLDYLEGQH